MIQDQHNLNDEYFVREYHLILEQILDVFIKKINVFYLRIKSLLPIF
jgi:hypothetical protein